MVVHTAAHTAVHERSDGRLLRSGVEQILRLVVAVHRASGQTVLREAEQKKLTVTNLLKQQNTEQTKGSY